MRVLVCGGRAYEDREAVFRELSLLQSQFGALVVIEGGARGADEFAKDWAIGRSDVLLIHEPAQWETYGRAAGPIRNQKMIDDHKPDMVLAFPGGRGTADMVRRARSAGINVVIVADKDRCAATG